MNCGCTASIKKDDERAEIWEYVFGKLSFPLVGPVSFSNSEFPGKRFVKGDVESLTVTQRMRLIEKMAEKFHITPAEVADSLKGGFVPILDEHVTISYCRLHSRMMV